MAKIAPYVFWQEMDNSGNPLSGGLVYTYIAGTTTPKVTYTDATESVSNANPVVLDSSGRANIWLGAGGYKFEIRTSGGVLVRTVDGVTGDTPNAFASNIFTTSSTITIDDTYANSLVLGTATLTLNLTAAATLGLGFYFIAKNIGSGTVTIDPSGAELIDGAATYSLLAGNSVAVICDGTQWRTVFDKPINLNQPVTGNLPISNGGTGQTALVGTDISSATTTDIGASAGNAVNVTGTTTITGLGTVGAGTMRFVTFTGILTLTHNATSLILPTGANITTAAGDCATFRSLGSGNWRCVSYTRASGAALAVTQEVVAGTPLVQDPYVLNTTSTQAHGLTAQPNFFKVELECKTAEFNYSIGDKIQLANQGISSSGVNAFQLLADATNTVLITHASDALGLLNKTTRLNTGAITPARWKLTVTPYLMS